MKFSITIFLILISSKSLAQNEYQIKTYQNPIDEIYDEILEIENSLNNTEKQNWLRIEKIICLSGVKIEKTDHQYIGLSYKPNLKEFEQLKKWFNQNKNKLYYSESSSKNKIIIYKNSEGNLMKSNCLY